MNLVPKKDLAALGLTSDMLGPAETLALPAATVDEARGAPSMRTGAPAPPLDATSEVLQAMGVDLRLDTEARALQLEWSAETAVRVRDAHPDAVPYRAAADGGLTMPVRQLGRFLVESLEGVPLVLGVLGDDALSLAAIGAWPTAPLAEWMATMNDDWLRSSIERALPGADAWHRAALAGMLARLTAGADPLERPGDTRPGDTAGDRALGLLRRVSQSLVMRPRAWARGLDDAAVAALEEHARRRALALAYDLDDLLTVLPLDGDDARATWTRMCHRRDDLEGVRLLLREAGGGASLEPALLETDRAGRAMRASLGGGLATDDERLRRVALGDPAAWWGDPVFEVRLL